MADINTGPQPIPVSGNVTVIPASAVDRTAGAVPTGTPQTPVPPTPIPASAVDSTAGAAPTPYQGGVTQSRATVTVAATTVVPPAGDGGVIPAPAGALPISVADEGTTLTTAVRSFNFVGDGVVAVANTQNNAVTVTITGGNVISNYSNANVAAYLPTNTSNVSGNYFIGNGSLLTGIVAVSSYANANVAAYLPTYTGNLVSLTGNVTTTANISGSYILGNGSQLTGLAATYSNTNVVSLLSSFGSNIVSTTGNISGGNILTGGLISATGNITGNFFIGNGSQLTGIAASYGNANVVANLAALGTNPVSTTGNISGNYFIGNGRQLTSVGTSFENEIHVAQNGNDTSGDGTINYPYLTIQKGVDISASPLTDRRTVVVHPGTYIENVTVTFNNTQIITYDLTGASTTVSGTLTLANNTQRLAGIKITNLTIAGNTQAYINSCTVTGQLTKSSSGYVEMVDVDMSVSGNVQITGGGTTLIDSNKIVNLRVANASASVSLRNVNQVYSPAVTAGTLSMFNCFVQASGSTANAITASAGTVLQLFNTTIYNLGLTAPARISVGGFYQLSDTQYDRANSVLGTSLGAISFFQSANIDSVTVNTTVLATGNITGGNMLTAGLISATGNVSGGNLTTAGLATVTGNITGGNLNTGAQVVATGNITGGNIITAGNVTGNFFVGNGSQLTGITANTGNVTFSSEIVIGTGTSNLISGLYLAPSSSSANANMYLRVRGNVIDEPTHIHFDTGNNAYYNQFIGDDYKYVQLANTGNIVINTNNYVGNTAQWNFDYNGVLTLPNGASLKDTAGDAVSFGQLAGNTTQGQQAVAIGLQAGFASQGNFAVAVGKFAANTSQGTYAVAVGPNAGFENQLANAVAIGSQAGASSQGTDSVAVGTNAAYNTQGSNAVAVGNSAAYLLQGTNSVAIGVNAGIFYLGNSSIAIGANAGNNLQGNNSIIFNATGSNLRNITANTFTVAPVRNDVANTANVMFYNATSNEITYGNTISIAGNITGGNLSGTNITGTLTTAAQANITTVGTLGNLAVSGQANITQQINTARVSATGNITGGNLAITGNTATITSANYQIGYLEIPQVSLSANATTALTDSGKHFYSVSASNLQLTIANNTSVTWPVGTALTIVNRGTANVLVVPGTGVSLYLAGNSSSANRVVTTYGMATVINVAANIWMINGTVT